MIVELKTVKTLVNGTRRKSWATSNPPAWSTISPSTSAPTNLKSASPPAANAPRAAAPASSCLSSLRSLRSLRLNEVRPSRTHPKVLFQTSSSTRGMSFSSNLMSGAGNPTSAKGGLTSPGAAVRSAAIRRSSGGGGRRSAPRGLRSSATGMTCTGTRGRVGGTPLNQARTCRQSPAFEIVIFILILIFLHLSR